MTGRLAEAGSCWTVPRASLLAIPNCFSTSFLQDEGIQHHRNRRREIIAGPHILSPFPSPPRKDATVHKIPRQCSDRCGSADDHDRVPWKPGNLDTSETGHRLRRASLSWLEPGPHPQRPTSFAHPRVVLYAFSRPSDLFRHVDFSSLFPAQGGSMKTRPDRGSEGQRARRTTSSRDWMFEAVKQDMAPSGRRPFDGLLFIQNSKTRLRILVAGCESSILDPISSHAPALQFRYCYSV